MIALTLIVLIIGVIFSVDIAYMHMVRAELRTATDAAARAGAEALARTQNREVEPLTSVRVEGERSENSAQGPVSLFFGQFLGQSEFQPTQVATASSSVRDIALILDVSGSMNITEDGVSRIASLRDAVSVFIDEIEATSPNTQISLTTYSTAATRVTPITGDLDSVVDTAGTLEAAGFTNIRQALRFGSDSLIQDPLTRAFADKTIVLMTDGNYNVGGNPTPSAVVAADRGHSIHTVTFSSGANQNIMREVAEIGGGLHLHADDGADLVTAFRDIARALSVTLVE